MKTELKWKRSNSTVLIVIRRFNDWMEIKIKATVKRCPALCFINHSEEIDCHLFTEDWWQGEKQKGIRKQDANLFLLSIIYSKWLDMDYNGIST